MFYYKCNIQGVSQEMSKLDPLLETIGQIKNDNYINIRENKASFNIILGTI